MVFILNIFPAVPGGIRQGGVVPAAGHGDHVPVSVLPDRVIDPVEEIPYGLSGGALVAVCGLVQDIVGGDPCAQIGPCFTVVPGYGIPQGHRGVHIFRGLPEQRLPLFHAGVLIAVLTAGCSVEVQDDVEFLLRGLSDEAVQEGEGLCFLLHRQILIQDILPVEGEANGVEAHGLHIGEVRFRKEAVIVVRSQLSGIVVLQVFVCRQSGPELFFGEFRVLEVSVPVRHEAAVRIFQRLQSEGTHPALLQEQLSGVDAPQLQGSALRVIEAPSADLHQARGVFDGGGLLRHSDIPGAEHRPGDEDRQAQHGGSQDDQRLFDPGLHRYSLLSLMILL